MANPLYSQWNLWGRLPYHSKSVGSTFRYKVIEQFLLLSPPSPLLRVAATVKATDTIRNAEKVPQTAVDATCAEEKEKVSGRAKGRAAVSGLVAPQHQQI